MTEPAQEHSQTVTLAWDPPMIYDPQPDNPCAPTDGLSILGVSHPHSYRVQVVGADGAAVEYIAQSSQRNGFAVPMPDALPATMRVRGEYEDGSVSEWSCAGEIGGER